MSNRLSYALVSLALAMASSAAPTLSMWQSLNSTLGGRLQVATPFSMPCFSAANLTSGRFQHSATECASVMDNYVDRGKKLICTFSFTSNTNTSVVSDSPRDFRQLPERTISDLEHTVPITDVGHRLNGKHVKPLLKIVYWTTQIPITLLPSLLLKCASKAPSLLTM